MKKEIAGDWNTEDFIKDFTSCKARKINYKFYIESTPIYIGLPVFFPRSFK